MAIATDTLRRHDTGLSWRAIFVGFMVGLATQFLLTLLGVAIGLSTIDVTGGNTNAKAVGVGAGIWALIVPIVSWFLGAYAASYASGVFDRATGVLHGIAVWALGLVAVLFLLGSGISTLASSTFGAIGSTAQTLSQSGLVRRSDISRLAPEAQQAERAAQQRLQQLGPEQAENATRQAAKGAWGAFAAALLSFGAACLGGASGSRTLMGRYLTRAREEREVPRGPIVTPPRTTNP